MDRLKDLDDDSITTLLGHSKDWLEHLKKCRLYEPKERKRNIADNEISKWERIAELSRNELKIRRKTDASIIRYSKGQCRECKGSLVTDRKGETTCVKCGLVVQKETQ